ncbi:MAG: MFS transporter [Trueperaceae bacterium]|nr:MFS transporter [Trueperaceae bacterium]
MTLQIPPSLKHRNFFLLWLSLIVSSAGSQMQTWALFWHIRTLTEAPIALGGVGLARILPIVIFSLIGGSLADAVNRRTLMFFTQTVMMLSALALAALTLSGHIALWHMYTLTAIQAFAVAFDSPARQSLIPNLVPAKDLPNAFSMNSIAFQTGSIVGPALSGLVIAYWGQATTYLLNGLSYLAIFVALIMIGPIAQQTNATVRKALSISAIREGIQFIINQPLILSTMLIDFFATFFSSATTLMPIVARDVLHVGAVEYGWLSASLSLGAVVASLIISQIPQIRRQGMVFLIAVMAFGLATIGFGLARNLALAMTFLMFIGASDSVSMIIRNTIRQLQTPDYIRGRMISINQIFFMGGPQLGEIEAGLVAQFWGAPFAIVSGGVGCMIAVALIARRWPVLRRYNGDEPIKAGT